VNGSAWLTKVELSTWLGPVFGLATTGVIFALSRPIARFASKLAHPHDAAVSF
jgi:hypothetical protein